jgi:hypothetical protein
MTSHTGYLLIADISGYTAFLTSSEQDHANPILQSLLSSMVEQVGEPLNFWKMDGDAVLAYSTRRDVPYDLREPLQRVCQPSTEHHRQHHLSMPGMRQCQQPRFKDHGPSRRVR